MGVFKRLFARSSKTQLPADKVNSHDKEPGLTLSGRRERNDVPYALPKDLEEGERLNLQHYIFRYSLHGNYTAPLPSTIAAILDVGSGTGIWGQEMATQFPSARVVGIDLEPPQSVSLAEQAAPPPPNYHFVQGNLLEGLPFPDNMFDYTHQRMLSLALIPSHWPDAVGELVRVTRPGGWIELLEVGGTELHPSGPATTQLMAWLNGTMEARGFDVNIARTLGEMLKRAGLHSIHSRHFDIPVGAWDSHLGVLLEKDALSLFTILKPAACTLARITPEHFDHCLEDARKEWRQMKAHYRFYLAYGQKE